MKITKPDGSEIVNIIYISIDSQSREGSAICFHQRANMPNGRQAKIIGHINAKDIISIEDN